MQAERVVELVFGTESAGSGYLITPRHVLTARHVLAPLELEAACTVTPLVNAPSEIPTGRVRWFAPPAEDLDAAIVELDTPIPLDECEPVVYGSIPANDIAPHAFLCAGFPAAAEGANRTIEGHLSYVPGPQWFNLDVKFSLPRNHRKWAGLSGALVFCAHRAVGVVRTVDSGWDRTLTATPLRRMTENASFQAYAQAAGLALPAPEDISHFDAPIQEKIVEHVYLIDRKAALETVRKYLRESRKPVASQIFAFLGVDDDEHDDVIQQLSQDRQFQTLLGREAKSEDVIVPLPWPEEMPEIDPDEHYRILVERICAAANLPLPPPGQPVDGAALRKSFEHGVAPRAFSAIVRRRIAIAGHGRLLRSLIELWESLGSGSPVLLFLGLAWDTPPAPAPSILSYMRPKAPQTDAELDSELRSAWQRLQDRMLTHELSLIQTNHVKPWIEELRQRCRPVRPGQLESLRRSLVHRIGEGKRAREVGAAVSELLRSL